MLKGEHMTYYQNNAPLPREKAWSQMIQEEGYERVVVVLGQKILQLRNAMPGVVTCHVVSQKRHGSRR